MNVRDEPLLDVAAHIPYRRPRSGSTPRGRRSRAKAEHAASNGVTELLYVPVGPDAADELRRFAEMLAA